jgi:hypothetical protein
MGFNFGGFAGGLSQGINSGMQLARQYNQMQDENKDRAANDTLRDDLKALPQVGSGKYEVDSSKPNPEMGPPQTKQTGTVTDADQNQYVRQALIRAGKYDAAAKVGLQNAQGGYYTAQQGKTNQETGIVDDFRTQAKQLVTSFQGVSSKLDANDIPGAQSDLLNWAKSHGVSPTISQDGRTWTVDGQTYDATNPSNLLRAASALQNHAVMSLAGMSTPTAAIQAQQAGNQTQQVSNETAQVPANIVLKRAQAANQIAEASTAPARAAQAYGSANDSNARANHTTAMLPYDQGESAAKTGSYTADTDYRNAQTTGVGYTNGALKGISELKPEDFEPDANGVVKADGVVKQAAALKNAPSVYSADKSTDRNTDTITSRENISQANIQSKEKIAQWGNATKEDTAKIRAAGKGAGLAGENWVEDKNAFGQWHDTKSGAIMKMDPKNPNKPIIIKKPDAVGGIQTRMVRDNKTGTLSAAYVGKDGLYDNAAEAASSFGRSGVVPTKENPFGAGQTAALPNLPTR